MQFWFNIINHIKSLDGMNKWETNSVAVHHDPVTDPTGLNGKELSGNILYSNLMILIIALLYSTYQDSSSYYSSIYL